MVIINLNNKREGMTSQGYRNDKMVQYMYSGLYS